MLREAKTAFWCVVIMGAALGSANLSLNVRLHQQSERIDSYKAAVVSLSLSIDKLQESVASLRLRAEQLEASCWKTESAPASGTARVPLKAFGDPHNEVRWFSADTWNWPPLPGAGRNNRSGPNRP